MADWLNAALAGAYSVAVYRDGDLVPDLSAVDATLTTTNGIFTLTTPEDESHDWEVVMTPTLPAGPAKMRLSAISISGDPGVTNASARLWLDGAMIEQDILTTSDPVSPDPAEFVKYGNAVTLHITEDTP
jgi:hypothetical protein